MEPVEDEELPEETLPEELPKDVKKGGPSKGKMWAIIIVAIIVIAAIAGAWGLGLFGGGEDENEPPTDGAEATTGTTIEIGESVSFTSLAADSDGEIELYEWFFGDGTNLSGDAAAARNATHTYDYGGWYWVYHLVTDDDGATADNEDSMIRVIVKLYDPGELEELTNDTAPFAFLSADLDIIEINDTVTFDMTGCYGIEYNESYNGTGDQWNMSWEYLTDIVLDYGDGSDPVDITPAEEMTDTHQYTASGHYAAALTVTSTNGESTTVMRTIHVLSPEAASVGDVKNPNTYIYVTIGEPQYLDPAVNYETAGGEVLQNVYETLIWYDGDSAEDLVPMLATEVPSIANGLISEDGLNYTFNLRSGVTFHDGTAMDAADVEYSIERVLRIHDPAGPSWMLEQVMTDYISYYIGETVGTWIADSYNASWLIDALPSDPDHVIDDEDVRAVSEASIDQVDSDTITIRLTHPYPGFLQIMAYTIGSVVSMDYVEANGGVEDGVHNDWMDQHTCGSGPYKLVEWDIGSGIQLTRNDDYWGPAPSIKNVFILLATDPNTRMLMLQAGDADGIDLDIKYESLFQSADYRISKGHASFDMMFAGFNMEINATAAASQYGSTVPSDFFQDKNVRQAFVHLINYTLYIESVRKGNGLAANGPIPQGMFGFNESIPYYEYNLTAAEEYFKAAINEGTGNSWWDDGFTIALIYNAGNEYRETACQFMKQALESLGAPGGFEARIFALDWPSYLNALQQTPSPFPMFWLGWGPDYADPDDYVTPFLDSTYGVFPGAYTGYENASIDTLARQAAAELDLDLRYDLYSEISMLCYEDAPYIWFYQAQNFHIERSWISGYYYNPMYSNLYYPALSKG
ncbi:MAG TPA: hypothetical protein ENN25_00400 [Euryarchaeota archaeon]|nr:hypothetical protein [Euryarchaeota archaeon]